MKTRRKKNTHFVSDIDKYCAEFDRTHPLSASQQAEIKKYQAIYKKRNVANPEKNFKEES
jgi:hypothetical protein